MKFEPIIEMPCLVTGLWKRFSVHLFEGKVTLEAMQEIERRSEDWHDKLRGKVVEMVVTHIIKRWESKRTASATVILAQGLVGAMHRSVLTGMQMIVPAPHPVKVFGTIGDGVKWLAPHIRELCGAEATPEALDAGVSELVAHFKAR